MKLFPVVLLAVFICASMSAHADVKYPTDADFRAFRNVCAGGDVQSVNARLEAALKTWKASPALKVDVEAAKKDLGAVMEKVKEGAASSLYDSYVSCVQNLISKYLDRMNPAPVAQSRAVATPKTQQ